MTLPQNVVDLVRIGRPECGQVLVTSPAGQPSSKVKADADKRRHPRVKAQLHVALLDGAQRTDTKLHSLTDDLCPGGMFVRSEFLLEAGEEVALSFELPGGTKVLARGRIAHVQSSRERAGMGIAFTQLSDNHRQALSEFLAR